jgi:hypothetical protein
VGSGTINVLYGNIGSVGLETNTVIRINDGTVLDGDVRTSIKIPTVGILRRELHIQKEGDIC